MMRIAIVDDLSADAGKLREFICRWTREQGGPGSDPGSF